MLRSLCTFPALGLAPTRPCSSLSRRRGPCIHVQCAAKVRGQAKRRPKGAGTKRGFDTREAQPAMEPWEKELVPMYRLYYKPTFKPGRFLGPVTFKRDADGSCSAHVEDDVMGAQLLASCHPLFFLEGALGNPPPVEDLHVSLLEDPPPPHVQAVLQLLPRRPPTKQKQGPTSPEALPTSSTSSSGSESGDSVVTPIAPAHSADSSGTSAASADVAASPSTSSSSSSSRNPKRVPWEKLNPRTWATESAALADLKPLASGALMRVLQRSSWSEEFQDAAASQVRHERPVGYIGVWPEHAYLAHSCVPNTSAIVVNRYMFIHSTDDLPAGCELTFNKIGRDVIAPLSTRQQAVRQMTGRPCSCRRCQAEERLPGEVVQLLQQVHDDCGGRWGAAMQEGLLKQDTEALAELQAEILEALNELQDALDGTPLAEEEVDLVRAAVYDAYDLAWQLEELVEESPDLDLLGECINVLKVFGRGSEAHVFAATSQYQAMQARAEEAVAVAGAQRRRTAAAERRILKEVQELLEVAQGAEVAFFEAMYYRYGYIGDQGLLPQLVQGLALFFAGLRQMTEAEEMGDGEASRVREMELEGIPVTVVDTVEGVAAQGGDGAGGVESGAAHQQVQSKSLQSRRDGSAVRVQLMEDKAPVTVADKGHTGGDEPAVQVDDERVEGKHE